MDTELPNLAILGFLVVRSLSPWAVFWSSQSVLSPVDLWMDAFRQNVGVVISASVAQDEVPHTSVEDNRKTLWPLSMGAPAMPCVEVR